MNILEYKIYPTLLLFIAGVLNIIGGVRIIATRKFILTDKYASTPLLIKGKEAVSHGIRKIIVGIILLTPFTAIYLGWINVPSNP